MRSPAFSAGPAASFVLSAALAILFLPGPAFAYVGPPAAIGTLGAILGIAITILGMAFHLTIKAARHLFSRISRATGRRSVADVAE